jgi:prevent-host-death family protein
VDTIDSFEAKTKFAALLRRVEHGEQIIITRRGKPIARLMPIATPRKVSDAVTKLRELRKGTTLGDFSWKELRDSGRKY